MAPFTLQRHIHTHIPLSHHPSGGFSERLSLYDLTACELQGQESTCHKLAASRKQAIPPNYCTHLLCGADERDSSVLNEWMQAVHQQRPPFIQHKLQLDPPLLQPGCHGLGPQGAPNLLVMAKGQIQCPLGR